MCTHLLLVTSFLKQITTANEIVLREKYWMKIERKFICHMASKNIKFSLRFVFVFVQQPKKITKMHPRFHFVFRVIKMCSDQFRYQVLMETTQKTATCWPENQVLICNIFFEVFIGCRCKYINFRSIIIVIRSKCFDGSCGGTEWIWNGKRKEKLK